MTIFFKNCRKYFLTKISRAALLGGSLEEGGGFAPPRPPKKKGGWHGLRPFFAHSLSLAKTPAPFFLKIANAIFVFLPHYLSTTYPLDDYFHY